MKVLRNHSDDSGFVELMIVVVAVVILAVIGYTAYKANRSHHAAVVTPSPGVTPRSLTSSPTPSTVVKPSPTPQPSNTVAPTPTPSETTFKDTNIGQTVYVKLGSSFIVSLGSTYWAGSGITSSNSQIVKADGALIVTPASGCVPGEGCGTTAQQFQADAVGQVTITASRTSCGEGRTCTGSEGKFNLIVIVQS